MCQKFKKIHLNNIYLFQHSLFREQDRRVAAKVVHIGKFAKLINYSYVKSQQRRLLC